MGQVFIFIILGQIEKHAQSPFALIKDHVLLPQASMLQADALFKTILTPETLQAIVNLIPLEWLDWQDTDESPDAIRSLSSVLSMRLHHSQIFIKEAQNARETLI
jgi:hypothetical protein